MLDPLTLDQLRNLVAVAETGSFSAAARQLGRVQSAVSQSIQTLETALGTQLFDRSGKVPQLNDNGRVLLADARRVLSDAEVLKARADSISLDVEPELTLAVDPIFPIEVLADCLAELAQAFPELSVTLYTEVVGGAEQRLRDGTARIALYTPFGDIAEGRETEFLVSIPIVPVVAAGHPLAQHEGPLGREVLEPAVQLVLTDRTPVSTGFSGNIVSRRIWRFVDLTTRNTFLRAGFGWCFMPVHMVRDDIASGRLKVLDLKERSSQSHAVHVVHERGRTPGRAGRWLIERLRERVATCVAHGLADPAITVS